MPVSHLEVLVEEPSMESALRGILPKVLGDVSFEVYPHQCKEEMLRRLPDRLRGYSHFIPADWRVLVVVDRDDDDCLELKTQLEQFALQAGLPTRSSVESSNYIVVNRIAIEELESWYFGDWGAVLAAFPKVPATIPYKARYRIPDRISGGTWEAFERICQKAGYFKNGLRKIEAAIEISKRMVPDRNTSGSFRALRAAVVEMTI